MNPSLRSSIAALCLTIPGTFSIAGAPDEQMTFLPWTGGSWKSEWPGLAQRTYFYQWSHDLVTWHYAPHIAFGTGGHEYFMEASPDKLFVRLHRHDDPSVTTLQQARDADFDGDGIPNWFEVENLGTNPLDRDSAGGDSDGDGLPDGWELYWFDSLAHGPQDINPHTGLTHLQSHAEGRNPNVAAISGDGSQVNLVVFTRLD